MLLNRSVPDVKVKRIRWKGFEKILPVDQLVFRDDNGVNLGILEWSDGMAVR